MRRVTRRGAPLSDRPTSASWHLRLACACWRSVVADRCGKRHWPDSDVRLSATRSRASRRPDPPEQARTSVKFAVIGDSGRGTPEQHEVAGQMVRFREEFPVRVRADARRQHLRRPGDGRDYRAKFEEPYQALLDAGVRFFAVLGNHDDPRQVSYAPFNMNGERYYSFAPPEDLLTRV